jgi:hypothetical protein
MLVRALLLTMCAACATAGGQQPGGNANGPGPDAGHPLSSGDDAAGEPDAAPHTDATVTTPDAPASGCAYSGVLATWSMSGQPGTQTSTAAASSAPGVIAASLTRAGTLTAVSGTGSMNSSNWATAAALDATKYYTVSLTPPTGCTLSVSAIAIDLKASSTGPASAAVATSADSFAQPTSASPNAASSPAVTVSASSGPLEIRIYGYGAMGATGTMRVQNTLTVTGTLQ